MLTDEFASQCQFVPMALPNCLPWFLPPPAILDGGGEDDGRQSGRTAGADRYCAHDEPVDPAAGTPLPEISEHHTDTLLPEFTAGPRAALAAPDINVNPVGCACMRVCVCVAFLEMLSRMLRPDTAG